MPKGKAVQGFAEYRPRQSATISALISDGPFLLNGQQFQAGDFIVKNPDGSLTGKAAAEFDEQYERVKKTWTRTKKDKGIEAVAEVQPETQAEAA
jgi:hypothetical protein